jgi:hypothetical protein
MWKNTEQPDRPQTKTWHMRTVCWITEATNTHSEYEILIALPRQQWLRELALMLLVYVLLPVWLFIHISHALFTNYYYKLNTKYRK